MKGRAKFYVLLQRRFRWVFSSPFNLDISTVNCTTEIEEIQREKVALNPLVSSWSVYTNLVFVEEIKDQIYTRHCSKQTSKLSQLQNKHLNSLTITYFAIQLLNKGKFSYVNQSSMRVNNTFRKIIDCFWRKRCRDSPCQTSSVVVSKVYMRLFFLRVSNWQVSDCDRYL